jgi:hypothetical protein
VISEKQNETVHGKWNEERKRPGGRNMNNPVQVARSGTQLGDGKIREGKPARRTGDEKRKNGVPRGINKM